MTDLRDPWGSLYVLAGPSGTPAVIDLLERILAEEGLRRVSWTSADRLIAEVLGSKGLAQPAAVEAGNFEADEIYVIPEAHSPFVSVMSRRWELPRNENPLAKGLSRSWPVLEVQVQKKDFVRYSLYKNGTEKARTVVGTTKNQPVRPLPPLDLLWFRGKEAGDLTWFKTKNDEEYRQTLGKWLPTPDRFIAFIGLSGLGHFEAMESAPISDYSPNEYLVFRKKPAPRLNTLKNRSK